MLARLGSLAKAEATDYSARLYLRPPLTVTTVKPAGTTAKLFGLTEGAHLPARRQYLRWVQFRGTRGPDGGWQRDSDPLLPAYEARGYPIRTLRSFPGAAIVGFPTTPLLLRLGAADRLVTAQEATPAEHFAWLRLLERHWIGAERGNQVSYTLQFDPGHIGLDAFRSLILDRQPTVRACTVLPMGPALRASHEYLPEEDVGAEEFQAILSRIRDAGRDEALDLGRLACARQAGPG